MGDIRGKPKGVRGSLILKMDSTAPQICGAYMASAARTVLEPPADLPEVSQSEATVRVNTAEHLVNSTKLEGRSIDRPSLNQKLQRAMVGARIVNLSHGGDRVSDQAADLRVELSHSVALWLSIPRFSRTCCLVLCSSECWR